MQTLVDAPPQQAQLNLGASTPPVLTLIAPASPLGAVGASLGLAPSNPPEIPADAIRISAPESHSPSVKADSARKSSQPLSDPLVRNVLAPVPVVASLPPLQSSPALLPPTPVAPTGTEQETSASKLATEVSRGPMIGSGVDIVDSAIAAHRPEKQQPIGKQADGNSAEPATTSDQQTSFADRSSASAAAAPGANNSNAAKTALQADILTPLIPIPATANGGQQFLGGVDQPQREDSPTTLNASRRGSTAGEPKGKEAAPDVSAAPTRDLSSANSQAAQRPNMNLPQTTAAAQPADSRTLQSSQGAPLQSPIHAAAPVQAHAVALPQTSRAGSPPPAAPAPELPAQSTVNTANLLQKMGEAEMRVAMHSTDYGAISVRTSISQQQILAQISVDHGELSKALTAHIPAVEGRLGNELGMRTVVQVSSSGMPFSAGDGNAQHGGQRSYAPSTGKNEVAIVPAAIEDRGLHLVIPAASDGRLDIRV